MTDIQSLKKMYQNLVKMVDTFTLYLYFFAGGSTVSNELQRCYARRVSRVYLDAKTQSEAV